MTERTRARRLLVAHSPFARPLSGRATFPTMSRPFSKSPATFAKAPKSDAVKPSSPGSNRTVEVRAEPIELCQLLKFAGLAESGGSAKQLITDGEVRLNGVVETQKRKKIMAGDKVTFGAETITVKVG